MAETLEEVAREELADLWGDLLVEMDSAIGGRWSMGCDNLVCRIKRLTPLVGPTPWENIQIRLLEDGTTSASTAKWVSRLPSIWRGSQRHGPLSTVISDALAALLWQLVWLDLDALGWRDA